VKILKTIAWTLVAVVSILFAIVLMVDGPSTPKTQDSAETESRNIEDIEIVKFSLDYHSNEVAADVAYKGRRFRVSSIVDEIRKDAFGRAYLTLEDFSGMGDIRANLRNSEMSRAATISPFALKEVYLVCTGGSMVLDTPTLEDCVFANPPPTEEVSKPSSAKHKPAPIIDGPAYTASQAEKELEKDQANSVVGPNTAGQPHDDGNGIPADPDTASKP
jgi:hypothetical protein